MSEVARRVPTTFLKDPKYCGPIRIPLKVDAKIPTGYECTTFDGHKITVTAADEMFPNMYYEAIFDLSDDIPRGETYDVALAIELGQSFDFHHYSELVNIMMKDSQIF